MSSAWHSARAQRPSVAWRALCVFTVLVFVFLLAPIAVIVVEAFDASDYMAFPPRQLSLRWFHAFFQNAEFMSALKVSTQIGLSAAAISTLKIGRAHVCTPVTNAHLVCRLLLEKKKKTITYKQKTKFYCYKKP